MPSSGAAAPQAAASRISPAPSSSARAQASRINGAKSRGPRTPEGKARVSQNALKHGFCAKKFLLMPDDSPAQFAALQSALLDDLAPEGAVQTLLAHRLIAAAWRLARADRLEFELFLANGAFEVGLGLGMIRDGHSGHAFPTLVRYRGGAQAELFRTLKALKALQAEAARSVAADVAPGQTPRRAPQPQEPAADPALPACLAGATQDAAERRGPAQGCVAPAPRNEPDSDANGQECVRQATPNEPEPGPTPDGPALWPGPAAAGPQPWGEADRDAAGRDRSPARPDRPGRIATATATAPAALLYGDCTPRALR